MRWGVKMQYAVSGRFRMGRIYTKFKKTVDVESEKDALERVYSLLGSEHKVKRHKIKIDKVEAVK